MPVFINKVGTFTAPSYDVNSDVTGGSVQQGLSTAGWFLLVLTTQCWLQLNTIRYVFSG
jgi:hypothetical protein